MKNSKNLNRESARTMREIAPWIVKAAKLPEQTILNLARLWAAALPLPSQRKHRIIPLLISIWIIVADRIYESPKVSLSDLRIFKNNIAKIAGKNFNGNNSIVLSRPFTASFAIFQEINYLLLKNNPEKKLLNLWASAVNDFLQAMVKERSFSKDRNLNLTRYIENGRKSIGSSVIFYALLISMLRGSGSLSCREFDIIKKSMNKLSIILRLANDLGSFERERQKKLFNGLAFLIAQGYSFGAAQDIFQNRIRRGIGAFNDYKKRATKKIKPFFAAVGRLLEFTFRFYEKNDYHS